MVELEYLLLVIPSLDKILSLVLLIQELRGNSSTTLATEDAKYNFRISESKPSLVRHPFPVLTLDTPGLPQELI